jgi:crossover junction endodeoxyribonuclease RuvC
MNILALDPATHCGWATRTAYGVWNLSVKKDESDGMRLIRLKSKLLEILKTEGIELVVFERPGGLHTNPIMVQSQIQGTIMLVCEENKIQYRAYSSGEIKKFATGKGNANKYAMILAAEKKYGYKGDDDNEADALHLLHLAQEDYGS